MTPFEVQIAAADTNNEIRATEIQLRQQVRGWFTAAKPSVFKQINNELITQTVANTNPMVVRAFIKDYDTEIYYVKPLSKMGYEAAEKTIKEESATQCNLIGDFIKAQGHNLVNTTANFDRDYGIMDIQCQFTFGTTQK
jgi:hypothetical protein